jgi:hypothetical protein
MLTHEDTDSYIRMQVQANGVIGTEWNRPQEGADSERLKILLREALARHGRLYERWLEHRGDVAVALSARSPIGEVKRLRLTHVPWMN